MLPLTFANPDDYELIGEQDRVSIVGLPPVPGEQVTATITSPDGNTTQIHLNHTFSSDQVEWFVAGSALNIVRQRVAGI